LPGLAGSPGGCPRWAPRWGWSGPHHRSAGGSGEAAGHSPGGRSGWRPRLWNVGFQVSIEGVEDKILIENAVGGSNKSSKRHFRRTVGRATTPNKKGEDGVADRCSRLGQNSTEKAEGGRSREAAGQLLRKTGWRPRLGKVKKNVGCESSSQGEAPTLEIKTRSTNRESFKRSSWAIPGART
jgi:hypothetical protein